MTEVERLMALFPGLEGIHGTHGVPVQEGLKWAIKPTAKTVRASATLDLWIQHIEGKRPLGVVPIMADSTCRWGSIDVDQYGDDMIAIVGRARRLFPCLVPCWSKSGGLHLFLFLEENAPAALVRLALQAMAALLGLAGQEIFPKQKEMLEGDAGSWMVMPYYGDTYGGKLREQVGVKVTGSAMTLDEFLGHAEKARVSADYLEELKRAPAPKTRAGATNNDPGDFSDGPRCLQIMYEGKLFKAPGRNNALFMMGVYLKRVFGENGWAEKLLEYNRLMMTPPMTDEEVTITINSLNKKEYLYTCSAEPMASFCDAAVCRGRRFGVGEGSPTISGLTKIDNPGAPIWFVEFDGGRRMRVNTVTLFRQDLFQLACVDHMENFPETVKKDAWEKTLKQLLASVEIVPPEPDVGADAEFSEHLQTFLAGKSQAKRREEILIGMPWFAEGEDTQFLNGKHWFQLKHLMKYINTECGARDVKRGDVAEMLKKLGGGTHELWINGRSRDCWYIPDNEDLSPEPELGAPPIKRSPF